METVEPVELAVQVEPVLVAPEGLAVVQLVAAPWLLFQQVEVVGSVVDSAVETVEETEVETAEETEVETADSVVVPVVVALEVQAVA